MYLIPRRLVLCLYWRFLFNSNNQWPVEEEEEEDAEKLQKKCEVYWGLSDSTVNIAKLLLPPEYINTHTELSLNGTEPNAVDECTSNFDV